MTIPKKKSSRDDFPQRIKDILRARVNGLCSNPSCKLPTTGPGTADGSVLNLGKACHIAAAAPGGPRFDKSMTPEQRKSFSNGIWLCTKCSEIIDRDIPGYTETVLRTWKNIAENNARTNMESGSISNANFDIHPAFHGIQLFSQITSLDSRFNYNLKVETGMPSRIELLAKENVPFELLASTGHEIEVDKKMRNLYKFGEPFSVNSDQISIVGSPLLSAISRSGVIRLGSDGLSTDLRLSLFSGDGASLGIISVTGRRWNGSIGLKVEFSVLSDMLRWEVYFDPSDGGVLTNINMKFRFEAWKHVSIYDLPEYNWLSRIAKCFKSNGYVKLEIKVNNSWHAAIEKLPISGAPFHQISHGVDYVHACKALARELGINLEFNRYFEGDLSLDEIKSVTKSLRSKIIHKASDVNWPIRMFGTKANTKEIPDTIGTLRYMENESKETVQIFGKSISLPPRTFVFNNVSVKEVESLEHDMEIELSENLDTTIEIEYQAFDFE